MMKGNARIDSSSISASLALHLTNQISAKKHMRVLKALYRVRSLIGTGVYACRRPTFVFLPRTS